MASLHLNACAPADWACVRTSRGMRSSARRRGRKAPPLASSNGGRKSWFRNANPLRFTGKYAGPQSATDSENAGCFGQSARGTRARLPHQKTHVRMKEIAMNKDQAAGGWKELK